MTMSEQCCNLANRRLTDYIPPTKFRSKTLILDGNDLLDIRNVKYCTSLLQLSACHNQIEDMSPVGFLPHLRLLHLINNVISRIAGVGECGELAELNLSRNCLQNFTGLYHCTSLVKLDLSYNSITTIADLSPLTQLQELYLHGNVLATLEAVPHSLPRNLLVLALADNKISDIGQLAYLTRLKQLERITLQGNSCCSTDPSGPSYGLFVVMCCSGVTHIDDKPVTDKIRREAKDLEEKLRMTGDNAFSPKRDKRGQRDAVGMGKENVATNNTGYNNGSSYESFPQRPKPSGGGEAGDRSRLAAAPMMRNEAAAAGQVPDVWEEEMELASESVHVWVEEEDLFADLRSSEQVTLPSLTEQELSAVVKIQAVWRGYKVRQANRSLLHSIALPRYQAAFATMSEQIQQLESALKSERERCNLYRYIAADLAARAAQLGETTTEKCTRGTNTAPAASATVTSQTEGLLSTLLASFQEERSPAASARSSFTDLVIGRRRHQSDSYNDLETSSHLRRSSQSSSPGARNSAFQGGDTTAAADMVKNTIDMIRNSLGAPALTNLDQSPPATTKLDHGQSAAATKLDRSHVHAAKLDDSPAAPVVADPKLSQSPIALERPPSGSPSEMSLGREDTLDQFKSISQLMNE